MKKNKLIFIILSLFLLSGCSFEYNIHISDDLISEDNTVYLEGVTKDNIEVVFENMVNKYTGPTNSLGMYSSSVFQEDDFSGVSYKRDYNYFDYNYSVSFSACYDAYKLIEDNDKVIISTDKIFTCFDKYDELDSVVVNLTSDYYVEEANADVIDDNTYTWYITKDNANNKPINVTIDLTNNIVKNKSSWLNSFTLVVIAFAIIGVIMWLVSMRGKKKNKV